MSQIPLSASRGRSTSRAAANTAAVADAISARAERVRSDLQALATLERTRPLTREEQDRAEWLRWLSSRLAVELTTLRQELIAHGADNRAQQNAA